MLVTLALATCGLAAAVTAPAAGAAQDVGPDAGSDAGLAAEVELAEREYRAARFWKCEDILRDLLADEPDFLPAAFLLLRTELAQGDLESAAELASELDELAAGGNEDRALAAARLEYAAARGRLDAVEAASRALLERDPSDLEAARWLAWSLDRRGRRDEARELVAARLTRDALAALDSERATIAGEMLFIARRYPEAASLLVRNEKALRDQGRETARAQLALGDVFRAALDLGGNDQPKAFAAYRDALAQRPDLAAARAGRIWLHIYVFDTYDAERELEEALALHPRDPELLTVKAWIRLTDARWSDALELLDEALEFDPSHRKARAVRAAALLLLRRMAEHDAECREVLAIDPSYGELWQTIGDALSAVYRFEEAVPFHRRAIELDPELPLAQVSLGRDLGFCGLEHEAREALEESLETHPYDHPWRKNMQLVLSRLEKEYVDRVSENFRLRMHIDENPVLGPLLQDALEQDLEMLSAKYGWQVEREVLVENFPDMADFSVRAVGFTGVGAVGVCFGHLVALVSPRSQARQSFVWRRTALHELAHVITLGRSKKRVPRWLTEGLSVYEERCIGGSWNRDQIAELHDAVANDDLLELRTFNAAFRGPRIGFAYYQAGLFCEFVVAEHGFDKILAMLDAYAEDLETPGVIERVFGRDCEALDAEFEAYLATTYLDAVRRQPIYGEAKRSQLRDELRDRPDDVALLAELAWACWQGDKKIDAEILIARAQKIDPRHPPLLRLLARRALEQGRPQEGKRLLEEAFAAGGTEYAAAIALAQLRAREGDDEGAEAALRLARGCFPEDPSPQGAAGQLRSFLKNAGRDEDARAVEEEIVDLVETDVALRTELAAALLDEGDAERALRYASQAIDVDPFVRRLHVLRARALRSLSRAAEAISALRVAALVDPRLEPSYSPPSSPEDRAALEAEERRQQAELLAEIAEVELESGDVDAARRGLERALHLAPDSDRVKRLAESLSP
jgi:tetratricopeptide (TPR) repeat protein